MAFRLSQKAFGQVLRTQTRSLTCSAASKALARSSVLAPAVTCARVNFTKAFSTSRVAFNENQAPVAEASESESVPEFALKVGNEVYMTNLPFFTDKKAFQELLVEFGPIEGINWLVPRRGQGPPTCFVRFRSEEDAKALIESSKLEPFFFGGRQLRIEYPRMRSDKGQVGPPSNRVYFSNFRGDMPALKEWLGPHATNVNDAFFLKDKSTHALTTAGMLAFTTLEQATEAIESLSNTSGPDGQLVSIRYAHPRIEQSPRNAGSN